MTWTDKFEAASTEAPQSVSEQDLEDWLFGELFSRGAGPVCLGWSDAAIREEIERTWRVVDLVLASRSLRFAERTAPVAQVCGPPGQHP